MFLFFCVQFFSSSAIKPRSVRASSVVVLRTLSLTRLAAFILDRRINAQKKQVNSLSMNEEHCSLG
jgi:hypothetical protein